jgi:hypothetical protein
MNNPYESPSTESGSGPRRLSSGWAIWRGASYGAIGGFLAWMAFALATIGGAIPLPPAGFTITLQLLPLTVLLAALFGSVVRVIVLWLA